jgi:hypothetical protein
MLIFNRQAKKYNGGGILDFLKTAANFIVQNKDTIQSVASTAGAVAKSGAQGAEAIKTVMNVINKSRKQTGKKRISKASAKILNSL